MRLCKFTLALALVAAACFPASAQSTKLILNIPFDFTVSGKTLPAGHYYVWETSTYDSDGWAIKGEHGGTLIMTHHLESPTRAHAFSLVFLRAGDQYFLAQIWNAAHSGHELQVANMKSLIVAEANSNQYVEVAAK
jgi:hypothetical protein